MQAERIDITALKPGANLDQVFLVREKELRTTRKGDLYVTCTLADKTGTLPARMWQASEAVFKAIPTEGFLHVRGRCEDYRGSLQCIIDACRPFPAEKVDLGDYMAVSELDAEEMLNELLELLKPVKDPHLKRLIKKFLEDHQLLGAFKKAPAAMTMHNAYIGGLLEHTLAVTRNAAALLPLYPQLNADLVLTGSFLHDIGKCAELKSGLSTSYTERGMLVGHITIAAIWVQEKALAVGEEIGEPFPPRLINLLQHIVLSHHGAHEFGSPKLPAIPEAYFLHYLDNLDAKMYMTLHAIESDPDGESDFTSYQRMLETRLFKRSGGGVEGRERRVTAAHEPPGPTA